MPIVNAETITTSEPATANRSYLIPFILVTSLFFLWGLANIMNSALIAHFQPVFEISRAQALLVETAFYLGYFTIAIPAGLFMEKYSYKKGILFGLILYACGALLFIPAAKLMTFGFFLVALYVIASGLAFLETAANPYVTILGKPETAVQRLNFSQSFNGAALVFGPWIAGQFIFSGNEAAMTTTALKQQAADAVIFPYVMLAVIVLMAAFLFFITKMPEPNKGTSLRFDKAIFKKHHLMFAVLAQLFYVGGQVGIWGITINYVTELIPGTSKEDASKYYMAAGTILFVSGRFLGTFIMTYIKDHKLLTIYAAITSMLCFVGIFAEGTIAVYALLATNFFMSIMFPTIFGLGVRNLGEYTKLGSSLIIMSIVGGAILPPLMGVIADNISIQQSLIIPALSFIVVLFYGWSGYKIKTA
ncbi:L-fucose:H+ symporter permease [Ohtaekwangia koreensis]|uniref:MFS transporter, FHS family, L-fucose permease n=1 Tax=Ohtaekwangia koreensis TaxID=688867 RepID=A0A1T5MF78_9BACT|nr:L-fucose:H+ symporter permease [Ohtaekwangia koreensis]SKC86805.1 MFS transporter, FHS family, L-fucose permease [Ohtaekwangia koreensis]